MGDRAPDTQTIHQPFFVLLPGVIQVVRRLCEPKFALLLPIRESKIIVGGVLF